MQKIIYTNSNGLNVEFSNDVSIILTKIDGTGCPETEIQTNKSPYQDGCSVTNVSLKERIIAINATVVANNIKELFQKRQFLCSVFNPKIGECTLKYINDNGEKVISCHPEHSPIFGELHGGVAQDFLITLMCPSPFWLNDYYESEEIITWIGGWKFKFKLPFKFKTKGETKKNIYNSGHVETPIEVIFRGPAVNPSIINHATGEFIKVNRALTSDDTLYITTAFGNKKVEIEKNGLRTNAFNYIDLDSTFFSLIAGDNLIEYTTESLEPQSVEVRYKNRYLGV